MNYAAITFVLAELLLAINLPLWLFWAHEWRGAFVFAALMYVAWRLFKWGQQ